MLERRVKVIAFGRSLLRDLNGISKNLFIDMISALPSDAKIVGFQENLAEDTAGIFVFSASFPHVELGETIPKILPQFHRGADAVIRFIRLEY